MARGASRAIDPKGLTVNSPLAERISERSGTDLVAREHQHFFDSPSNEPRSSFGAQPGSVPEEMTKHWKRQGRRSGLKARSRRSRQHCPNKRIQRSPGEICGKLS